MKIRQGFVSNSSSSSFVCYGIQLNLYNLDLDTLKKSITDYVKECKISNEEKEELSKQVDLQTDIYEICETICGLPGIDGLEYAVNYGAEECYIGIDPSDYKDKTPKEVKSMAKKQIKKVFGKDVSVEYIQEGWYDG